MDLTNVINDRTRGIVREVTVTESGETLHAVIRPAGLSSETVQALNAVKLNAAGQVDREQVAVVMDVVPRALAEQVQSWDLNINGVDIAPTEEAIRALGIDAIQLLFTMIQKAVGDAPKVTPTSSGPSSSSARKPRKH